MAENVHVNNSPLQNPITLLCERLTEFEKDPDVEYFKEYPINKFRPINETMMVGDILLEYKQYARGTSRFISSNSELYPIVSATLNGKAFETSRLCDSVNMQGYSGTQFRTDPDRENLMVTAIKSGYIDTEFTHCLYLYEAQGKKAPSSGWNSADYEIIEPQFKVGDYLYVDMPSDATEALLEQLGTPIVSKPVLKQMSFPPLFHELKMYGGQVNQYTQYPRKGLVFYMEATKFTLMFQYGYMLSEMYANFLNKDSGYLTYGIILRSTISGFLDRARAGGAFYVARACVLLPQNQRLGVKFVLAPHADPRDHTEEHEREIHDYVRYCVKQKQDFNVCRVAQAGDPDMVCVLEKGDTRLPGPDNWLAYREGRLVDMNGLTALRPAGVKALSVTRFSDLAHFVKRM